MRRVFHMLDGTTRVNKMWKLRMHYRTKVRKKHPRRTKELTLEESLGSGGK